MVKSFKPLVVVLVVIILSVIFAVNPVYAQRNGGQTTGPTTYTYNWQFSWPYPGGSTHIVVTVLNEQDTTAFYQTNFGTTVTGQEAYIYDLTDTTVGNEQGWRDWFWGNLQSWSYTSSNQYFEIQNPHSLTVSNQFVWIGTEKNPTCWTMVNGAGGATIKWSSSTRRWTKQASFGFTVPANQYRPATQTDNWTNWYAYWQGWGTTPWGGRLYKSIATNRLVSGDLTAPEPAPDITAPVITITSPQDGTVYTIADQINVVFSASDPESGVTSLTATLDGVEVANETVLDAYKECTGVHILTVTATNGVGLTATKNAVFTITADSESLLTLANRLLGNGYQQTGGMIDPGNGADNRTTTASVNQLENAFGGLLDRLLASEEISQEVYDDLNQTMGCYVGLLQGKSIEMSSLQNILYAGVEGGDGTSITVIVKDAVTRTPLQGENIIFSLKGKGTLRHEESLTDENGKATNIYEATGNKTESVEVTATISGTNIQKTIVIFDYKDYNFHNLAESDFSTPTYIPSYNDDAFRKIEMSENDIQGFLEKVPSIGKASFLATYVVGGEKASTIVFNASKDFKVNPKVLLTTLQKEQGLITLTKERAIALSKQKPANLTPAVPGNNRLEQMLNDAMGVKGVDGFKNEIRSAAASFSNGFDKFTEVKQGGSDIVPVKLVDDPVIGLTDLVLRILQKGYVDERQTRQDVRFVIVNASTYTQFRYTPHVNTKALGGVYSFVVNWKELFEPAM